MIKEINVYEYILKANLLNEFLSDYDSIPLLVKDLQNFTEEASI